MKRDKNLEEKKSKVSELAKEAKPESEEAGEKRRKEFNDSLSQVIGEVVRLMASHRAYRYAFMSDIHWMVLPPVVSRQYKLITNNKGDTVGCVLWGEVTDRVRERLRSGGDKLQPEEWRGGPNAIVMQVLAPNTMEDSFLHEFKARVFSKRRLERLKRIRETEEMELVEIYLPTTEETNKVN